MSEQKPAERNETHERLRTLKEFIREGEASTQDELVKALRKKKFDVTQSTVSRDLRRIGAVRSTNPEGETVYVLPDEQQVLPPEVSEDIGILVRDIECNESLIVLHTTAGAASLVARYIDSMRSYLEILGTLAGDDTIFIVPESTKKISGVMKRIKEELE